MNFGVLTRHMPGWKPAGVIDKVGMLRTGPNEWTPHGDPAYLRASVEGSLRRLGVDCLDLCYLHRNDLRVPFLDQVGTLAALQREGKVAHVGLSKVTSAEIDLAATLVTVAAVQNKLSEAQPKDAQTAEFCGTRGIPYVPYAPLGAGALAQGGGAPKALRWLLDLGKNVAPIPGTSNPDHLRELVASLS
nr:aldo/keto reductase [Streptomyces sp. NBC_00857]